MRARRGAPLNSDERRENTAECWGETRPQHRRSCARVRTRPSDRYGRVYHRRKSTRRSFETCGYRHERREKPEFAKVFRSGSGVCFSKGERAVGSVTIRIPTGGRGNRPSRVRRRVDIPVFRKRDGHFALARVLSACAPGGERGAVRSGQPARAPDRTIGTAEERIERSESGGRGRRVRGTSVQCAGGDGNGVAEGTVKGAAEGTDDKGAAKETVTAP
eukprot:1183536-Prorocentrum_minimum.AAC.1